jgi:hypothetical protein
VRLSSCASVLDLRPNVARVRCDCCGVLVQFTVDVGIVHFNVG